MEQLILVNENDEPLGIEEKLLAHTAPKRHRAFSVFIFNEAGEMLIQRRALMKYHSPNLWANTCCGHPRPGEDVMNAAKRRLFEELGFTCDLTFITTVNYTLKLEKNLWELEYTHVFKGYYQGSMDINPSEVSEIDWVKPFGLRQRVKHHPKEYARWFRLYVLKYYDALFQNVA